MKKKNKNPYLRSYLSMATISCLALSIVFFYINYVSLRETQQQYYQKKAELLLDDLETQLEFLEETGLKISVKNIYQPFYFRTNKYNEKLLLGDFVQYSHYSTLTDEVLLYYGGSSIFHSSGNVIDINVHYKNSSTEEKELIRKMLTNPGEDIKVLSVGDKLYVLIPFNAIENVGYSKAVVAFIVEHADLEERFQIVSGGIEGTVSLYREKELLYSSGKEACEIGQKNVLSASTLGGKYTICYLPVMENHMLSGVYPLLLLLVLTDVMLVLIVASLFARRSYNPILEMTNKFRKKVSLSEEIECENALDEINFMMDSLIHSNLLGNMQIQQKQEMLCRQILLLLVSGNYSFNIQPYLDKLQIWLPGPYFYVISISFSREESVTEAFLVQLQKELEEITVEDEKEYVYTLADYDKKQISVICSIENEIQINELTECVSGVADSHGYKSIIGVGNAYRSLSRLSASWLESLDKIHSEVISPKTDGYIYDCNELYRVCAALSEGDESGALVSFGRYVKRLKEDQISLLMQQYIFADFLSEITRVAKENKVELPNQSISLIISAKNVDSFEEAARELIQVYCGKIREIRNRMEEQATLKVCEYVKLHFAEYDLSIEKVAADLEITAAVVRQSIFKHTGRMYKDYIIFLRIEYAKELLLKEDMPVADVCKQVGYGNISYFIKLFKEMTGVTPAKFRSGE